MQAHRLEHRRGRRGAESGGKGREASARSWGAGKREDGGQVVRAGKHRQGRRKKMAAKTGGKLLKGKPEWRERE